MRGGPLNHESARSHTLPRLVRVARIPFPQKFWFALRLRYPSSQHEERVAQPIQELDDLGIERFFFGQADADAFSPTTDRPCLVKRCRNLSSTGQNEFLERGQVLLASVDHALEFGRILRFDCRHILERLTWR